MVLEKIQSWGSCEINDYFESYFEELKCYLNPLFQYKQGNCHNVSHFASLILRNYGVPHKKIWIYAPTRYVESSKLTIKRPDPNNLSPKGYLSWGFHVALLIQYEGHDIVFDYFVDEEKPMAIGNWIENMNLSNFHMDIEKPEHYLFYSNASEKKKNGVFCGKYFEYKGLSKEENWLSKGLAINDTAIYLYKNEYYHFQNKTPMSDDYRLFAGSINNFECVLRDKSVNSRMTLSFQKKHKDFISNYRSIYLQNLEKWTSKINVLI